MGFLTGKTALITGAGRAVLQDGSCGSIGYGIATAYAKEGANLVITGRNVKKLEEAKQEYETARTQALAQADVQKQLDINTLSTLIYSEVRRGIKPSMYALSTVIFVAVLTLLLISNFAPKKKQEA